MCDKNKGVFINGFWCKQNIYSGVNGKWCRNSWKEFNQLKDIVQKYYCSNYYDVSVSKYGVKCDT